MKKIAIIICLIGCVSLASAKETIYVKYESASCIQQYHYKAATNSGAGIVTEYFDYHVNLKTAEKAVVRTKKVGTYKKADYSIAKNLVNCGNKKTHTFQSLIGKVATGEKEIFFIQEEGNNYHVYKGMSASYEIYNEKYFYSHSPEYAFKYIYNKDYVPSEKLKKDSGSGVTTMFAGTDTKGCNKQFGIVQMPEHACSSQVSKEFLKEIGLYIEKNDDGFFILKKIDNMLLNDYLKWRCSGFRTDLDPSNRPVEYDQITKNMTKGATSQPGNTAKGGASTGQTIGSDNFIIANYVSNKKETGTEYKYEGNQIIPTGYDIATKGQSSVKALKGRHAVIKGDTLYSLSKKYGISIEELKSWNNLSDNTIGVGDTIVVNKSAFVF